MFHRQGGDYNHGVWGNPPELRRRVEQAGRRGLVRVDPEYPWHFLWEGTGEHYSWKGTTTYWLIGWDDETIRASLDRLHRLEVNRVRVVIMGRVKDGQTWAETVYPMDKFRGDEDEKRNRSRREPRQSRCSQAGRSLFQRLGIRQNGLTHVAELTAMIHAVESVLMPRLKFVRFIPSAVMLCLLLTACRVDAGSRAVHVWQRWETALTSSKTDINPYLDVDLQATFTGPGGQTFQARGFWDGGQTFKIHFAFPQAGRWDWRTTCSDAANVGLHDRSGFVDVGSYTGDNPLYRHGFLGISENQRYLAHADGTPFLWIGDTAWLAYVRATGADWDRYIDDRARRGFSALLTSVSVTAGPVDDRDPEGNAPFLDRNARRWNPAFWKNFAAKVQSANDRGLVMVLTGVGFGRMKNAAPREVLAFARNLAARLAGNAVVYSPRQDWGVGHEEMLEQIGQEIHRAVPFALVTQHPRRSVGEGAAAPMPDQVLQHYYHLQSVDFVGVQTGPGAVPDQAPITLEEASRATLEWISALYQADPHKPVVNLEGVYDDDFAHDTPGIATAMARRGAYLSFLSGACGFTSSSYGLWMWGKGPPFGKWRGVPASVASAMDRPYATHLHHLASFLSGIEWWRLEPCPDLILNQPADWARRMALAKTTSGDLAVAYLPNNPEIVINLKSLSRELTGQWFNPRTGEFAHLSKFVSNESDRTFTCPGVGDWVLLLRKSRIAASGRTEPPSPPVNPSRS